MCNQRVCFWVCATMMYDKYAVYLMADLRHVFTKPVKEKKIKLISKDV